jgi:quercetin 2,3-dioxygenase
VPNRTGGSASYEQKFYDAEQKRGKLRLVASSDGADGSVTIQQDAKLYAGLFDADESATLAVQPNRLIYVHVARGSVSVNGIALAAGDAAKIASESSVSISHGEDAEVLLFDMATLQ